MLQLDYDSWDTTKDIRLERPGNALGYEAIRGSIDVGDMPSKRRRDSDKLIGPTIDGVIGLLAGGVEWLRHYGFSAAEVQGKVRAYKAGNLSTAQMQALRIKPESVEDISDPKGRLRYRDKTLVIG